jgi:hypothetical protein
MSRDDLEHVLNALVTLAKQSLDASGAFPPMAASVDEDRELELQVPSPADGGTTEELLDLLKDSLKTDAGETAYRVVAWCVEVEAQRPGADADVDAIAVHLESPTEALMAFVPFFRGEDGKVAYGEVFFGATEPEVFTTVS